MMRRLLPLLLLAGCATGPSLETRLAATIGQSELQVVETFGVPNRTYDTGGLRFLQYEERRQVLHQLDPYWGWGYPYGRFAPYSLAGPVLMTRSCDITFTLKEGRVQAFTTRGDDCR
ncbi:hypothetical protein [Belnapia rosea]|uniref:hypothetical protein n=1 Tax=Belnapia rosea TaxID=938405 RepID=UPI00115FB07E|nr:hypothetical protein [Belnapia rosea]